MFSPPLRRPLCTLLARTLFICLGTIRLAYKSSRILLNLLMIVLAQFRFFEIFSHLGGSLWGTGCTRSKDTAVRIGDGDQEISSGLPICGLVSEVKLTGLAPNLQFANMTLTPYQ